MAVLFRSDAAAWRLSLTVQYSAVEQSGFVHTPLSNEPVLPASMRLGGRNKGKHLQVFVRDNNVDQALRALKRKMQREGVFREMKRRKAYEKPSERRTREKAEAIRRARKAARKQAQREGLIPLPKRRDDSRARPDGRRRFGSAEGTQG